MSALFRGAAVVYGAVLKAVFGGMITDFPAKPIYNLGGYNSFTFSPIRYVSSVQRALSGSIPTSSVSFLAGHAWLSGYATRQTLVLTEEPQQDDQGNYYNITVAGFVPGDDPELEQILAEMEMQRHILVLKDPKAVLRLVGTKDQPLSFSASFGSGASRADQKGYSFKFYGSLSKRCPQYTP